MFAWSCKPRNGLDWPRLARTRCALRHTATELKCVDTPSRVRAGGSLPNTAAALMRGPSFLVAGLPGSSGQASYDARNARNQHVAVRNVGSVLVRYVIRVITYPSV
jgi:hypothetical protein